MAGLAADQQADMLALAELDVKRMLAAHVVASQRTSALHSLRAGAIAADGPNLERPP